MPALSPEIPVNNVSIHTIFPTFESRWLALNNKDPRAATAFLYCVKSTHIYCRPICTARLARRKNVVFYDTVDEAEQAGFRPCKRCKPRLPLHETHHAMIRQSCAILDESPDALPPLKDLAKSVGLTQWHFHRIFRRFTGITPRMYWVGRHNPEKQQTYNIDFEKLLEKLDGYSGEDPVNNRGQVPRRRLSDPTLMTENDIAQCQNGLNSTHESTENVNDFTTTAGGTGELELHSATSNSASNSGPNQFSTGLDNLVSSKSLREIPSTPLSSTSTPLFGVSSSNLPSTKSKYTTDKIPNTLGYHNRLFNSSTVNSRSPSLFPTSSSSSPSNALTFNKNNSLPSSGELPAFSPLQSVSTSETPGDVSSKTRHEQTSMLEVEPLNLEDVEPLHDLKPFYSDSMSNTIDEFSKTVTPANTMLHNNNRSTSHGRAPNHQKLHSISSSTRPISKGISQITKPSQLSKNQKTQQRASQRSISVWPQSPGLIAQQSPSLFPQSPAFNPQQSPLFHPQSPNIGPFQSPALNALQSPNLHALQSPALTSLPENSPPTTFKSEVLARQNAIQPLSVPSPISLSHASPNFLDLSDNSNQSSSFNNQSEKNLGTNSGISLRTHQLHQNLYRQLQSAKSLKTPQAYSAGNILNKKNNALLSGIPAIYDSINGSSNNDSNNRNNAYTPSSASPNSISPGSSGSPANGSQTTHTQRSWVNSNTSSVKSSPGFAVPPSNSTNSGNMPLKFPSYDVSGTITPNLVPRGEYPTSNNRFRDEIQDNINIPAGLPREKRVIQALIELIAKQNGGEALAKNDVSDLDNWLSKSVLKNLEGLNKENEEKRQNISKRPPMTRSVSTPSWINKSSPGLDSEQLTTANDLKDTINSGPLTKLDINNCSINLSPETNILRPFDFLHAGYNDDYSYSNDNYNDNVDVDVNMEPSFETFDGINDLNFETDNGLNLSKVDMNAHNMDLENLDMASHHCKPSQWDFDIGATSEFLNHNDIREDFLKYGNDNQVQGSGFKSAILATMDNENINQQGKNSFQTSGWSFDQRQQGNGHSDGNYNDYGTVGNKEARMNGLEKNMTQESNSYGQYEGGGQDYMDKQFNESSNNRNNVRLETRWMNRELGNERETGRDKASNQLTAEYKSIRPQLESTIGERFGENFKTGYNNQLIKKLLDQHQERERNITERQNIQNEDNNMNSEENENQYELFLVQ